MSTKGKVTAVLDIDEPGELMKISYMDVDYYGSPGTRWFILPKFDIVVNQVRVNALNDIYYRRCCIYDYGRKYEGRGVN